MKNTEFSPERYEAKWREQWENEKVYDVNNSQNKDKEKYYCLDMFPYPSGEGLHVGHWRGYVLSDVWSRYMMLHGYNVLHPMGWDNFGLPAENDAIKNGTHPKIKTAFNIDNMRRQLKEMGCVYDWNLEISTSHHEYYRWTQYLFLVMFKRGLAYQMEQPVNWCEDCKVVLANEEVAGGTCERCGGTKIEKRKMVQWMLKITAYADRLLNDLDELDWPEKVKEMQRNWIGKSIGAAIDFAVEGHNDRTLSVFTTRPDTLFGATFVVLAPEHPSVLAITTADKKKEVEHYCKQSQMISNIERQANKDKTGVFTGAYAVNPANNQRIEIWVSDYVLMDYGAGAIMSVPAHDERDFAFAKKYNIPIVEVIFSNDAKKNEQGELLEAYTGNGRAVNSDYINGLDVESAKEKVIETLEKAGKGKKSISYKLRDWIFARQRYWGEPIPIIHCETCGAVAVPEDQLPVLLPDVEAYKPTSNGQSPLALIDDWVNTTCPQCGQAAKRETDTMPQWAGSSWYFIRYPDKDNEKAFASQENLKNWLPVDMYVGGVEHAVLHLLYARFWTKVFYDEKLVPFYEPFKRLFNQGMVCRQAHRCEQCNAWIYDKDIEDQLTLPSAERKCPTCGSSLLVMLEKMSKSKGNVVGPDILVEKYGTDALRLYELFTGDPLHDSEWNDAGIEACYKLLKRSWHFLTAHPFSESSSKQAKTAINKLAYNVDARIKMFKFNTCVSAFMEFINEASAFPDAFSKADKEKFVILLSPFAPHFAEEIWIAQYENGGHVFRQRFPVTDMEALREEEVEIAIQFNGKLRMRLTIPMDCSEEDSLAILRVDAVFVKILDNRQIKKVIYVKNKIMNVIV